MQNSNILLLFWKENEGISILKFIDWYMAIISQTPANAFMTAAELAHFRRTDFHYGRLTVLMPDAMDPEKNFGYNISNERIPYGVRAFLSSLAPRVEFYAGICGGGTQNLEFFSIFEKSPRLKSVTLIDKEPAQLKHFKVLVDIFNSASEEDYPWHIMALTSADEAPFFLEYARKPRIGNDLTVTLKCTDITAYIRGISEKGVYFIYLSNVVQHLQFAEHLGLSNGARNTPNQLLDAIISNPNIADGSMLYFYAVGPVIVVKRGGVFRRMDYWRRGEEGSEVQTEELLEDLTRC